MSIVDESRSRLRECNRSVLERERKESDRTRTRSFRVQEEDTDSKQNARSLYISGIQHAHSGNVLDVGRDGGARETWTHRVW